MIRGATFYPLFPQLKMTTKRTSPASTYCKTCGSEIVQFVNTGAFDEGECDACEHVRYTTQPSLLESLKSLVEVADCVVGNWENRSLVSAVRALAEETKRARTITLRVNASSDE